jgi:tetratricopeptide (TPR) repeat protein
VKDNNGEILQNKLEQNWKSGDADTVMATLRAWSLAGGNESLEYQVQSVYANAMLERNELAATIRAAELLARARGDEIALARIAAAVIDALYSDWRGAHEARRWLDVLRAVAYARLEALPPTIRLQIAVGVLAADLFGEGLAIAEQVARALPEWCDDAATPTTVRSNALGYALEYFSGKRDWKQASAVVARLDPIAVEPGFGALARARLASRRGFFFHYRRGDYEGALAQSRTAIECARKAGVGHSAREAGITVALCHLMRGEIEAAGRALADEHASIPEGHLMMRANVHYERSWWHALRRDVVSAQRELDIACKLFAEIDEHGVMSFATPSLQAQLLIQVGEYESALRVFEVRLRRPDAWLVDIALIESLIALDRLDPERAVARLREGLSIAARIDIKGVFWACRDELSTLLDLAIAERVEVEWARSVGRARLLRMQ